jgi:hypothetical protein
MPRKRRDQLRNARRGVALKIARRTVLGSAAVLAARPVLARMPFRGGAAGIAPVVTHTVYNNSGLSQTNAPYVWGQAFRKGDIPAGATIQIQKNDGTTWPVQIDQIGPAWPDGSLRHATLATIIKDTIPNATSYQFTVARTVGPYLTTTPRSPYELNLGHSFQVCFEGVVNSSFTAVNGPSGSNNWLADVTTLVDAGSFEIFANGSVYMGVKVSGFLTDSGANGSIVNGAKSNWLWYEGWYWIYSDPATPSAVRSIEHIHRISQPFIDVASPDAAVGHITLCDNGTVLRDLSPAPIAFTQSAVTAASAGPVTVAGNGAIGGEVYKFAVVSGTPPSGLTNGQYVWASIANNTVNSQSQIFLGSQPNYPATGSNPVVLTTTGSGSFTLTRKTPVYYYQGAWITADDYGSTFWSVAPTGLFPNLDGVSHGTAEKSYYVSSGLIPGWDLTGGSAIGTIDGFSPNTVSFSSQLYRPGTVGMARFGISTGGGGLNVGPWTEWEARGFARFGATNWNPVDWKIIQSNALVTSHFPYAIMRQSATNRIPPVNNGPPTGDGSGPSSTGSYTSLGVALPTLEVVTVSSTSGVNIPASPTVWAAGPFTAQTANDHWPRQAIIAAILTGRRHLIELVRENASHLLVCTPFTAGSSVEIYRTKIFTSKTFYGCGNITQQPRGAMMMIDIAAAAILGDASDPEIPYFEDCRKASVGAYKYWLQTWKTSPTFAACGWTDPTRVYTDQSFMTGYQAISDSYHHNITRDPDVLVSVNNEATQMSIAWDGARSVNPFWATTEEWASNVNFDPSGPSGVAPTPSLLGPQAFYLSISSGAVFTFPGGLASGLWPLQNDDRVYVSGDFSATPPAYDGPPEFNPTTLYYICQLNLGAETFRLSTGPGGSGVITSLSTSYTLQTLTIFPQYAPASGLFNNYDTTPDGYGLIGRSALNLLTQTGATSATGTLATARSNANARWTGNYNTVGGSTAFKYSMTNAVTIV